MSNRHDSWIGWLLAIGAVALVIFVLIDKHAEDRRIDREILQTYCEYRAERDASVSSTQIAGCEANVAAAQVRLYAKRGHEAAVAAVEQSEEGDG